MGALRTDEVAFGLPGGESCGIARKRPIDLAHLARQTLGDRDLEREIVTTFLHQLSELSGKLEACDAKHRQKLAHCIKGSARSVGAFTVAECAADIEKNPEQKQLVNALLRSASDVREYIASLNR